MKNKVIAAVLAFFLGGLGIHKFYLGKTGAGVFYLLFCWTGIPAMVALIEAILYLIMSTEKFNLKYNSKIAFVNNVEQQQQQQIEPVVNVQKSNISGDCPKCNTPNDTDARFCEKCGNKLF